MSLVFVGPYTVFHHQCFKMVDVLMHHFEQNNHCLNPYATPHEPKKEKDAANAKEEEQQKDEKIIKLSEKNDLGWKIPLKTIIKRTEHEGTTIKSTRDKNNNAFSLLVDDEEENRKDVEEIACEQIVKDDAYDKRKTKCSFNVEDLSVDEVDEIACEHNKKKSVNRELMEIDLINNECSNVTNVLLCGFHEEHSRVYRYLEETDQSFEKVCIMHSELRVRFKQREKKWTQKVTELLEKSNLLVDYYYQTDDESVNDDQNANEKKPDIDERIIENMPQSLNDIMSDQTFSDESSSSIEYDSYLSNSKDNVSVEDNERYDHMISNDSSMWSPGSYDSD